MMPVVMSCSVSVRHAFGPSLVGEEDRPVLLDLVLRGEGRFLVGVDVVGRDVLRRVFVFLQPLLVPLEVGLFGEDRNLQGDIELREDVARLVGQAELLVGGQVPALVLTRPDVVDRDQDAQDDQDADAHERAVSRLAPREHLDDVAPLSEDVDEKADQAGVEEVGHVLVLLRIPEPDARRREQRRDAQPENHADDSIHHCCARKVSVGAINRATVRSRPTSRSETGRT